MKFIISLFLFLVLSSIIDLDNKKYGYACIYVDRPPEKVWKVLIDPYKFKDKKHMKDIILLENTEKTQIIQYIISVFFPIPDFNVTVRSEMSPYETIKFKRISGSFKDIEGSWRLKKRGSGTLVEYEMYLDTGFPIPQWIINKAQMSELPKTLLEFKKRAENDKN